MAWADMSEGLKHLILISGGLTALATISVLFAKVYKNIKRSFEQIAWLFSEQHDHQIIKASLDEIALQLTNNGGTSLKDAIDRIEHKQDFMTARMQTHLHTNDKALFETDREGYIIYINKAYQKLTGLGGGDAKEMGWVNVIDSKDRDRVVKSWFNAVKARRDFDEHLDLITADGQVCRARATAYIIRDGKGRMLGHIGEVSCGD